MIIKAVKTTHNKYTGFCEVPIELFTDPKYNLTEDINTDIARLVSLEIGLQPNETFFRSILATNTEFDNWVCECFNLPKFYMVPAKFTSLIMYNKPLMNYLRTHKLCSFEGEIKPHYGDMFSHIQELGITKIRSNYSFLTLI